MKGYCKTCHCSHFAWNRLNDGYICGLCGTRERDPHVTPVNASDPKIQAMPAVPRLATARR